MTDADMSPNGTACSNMDGFAGSGVVISRATGDFIPGSPLNALNVKPSFSEFHFVDLDGGRAGALRRMAGDRADVHVYEVDPAQAARMDAFWGDHSWRQTAYARSPGLFGDMEEKIDNDRLAGLFRSRLRDVARFSFVPEPLPMMNSRGAVVYYLFFASDSRTGARIVTEIFDKYRERERP